MSWQTDLYDLSFIDHTLKKIIAEKENAFGGGVITSLYRVGDPGVHGTLPLRGLDERCRYPPLGELIAGYLNERWIYDPERPQFLVCLCHDTGNGLHLHYQSHPRTVRRES